MSAERGPSSEKVNMKVVEAAGIVGIGGLLLVDPALALLAVLSGVYYISRKKKVK